MTILRDPAAADQSRTRNCPQRSVEPLVCQQCSPELGNRLWPSVLRYFVSIAVPAFPNERCREPRPIYRSPLSSLLIESKCPLTGNTSGVAAKDSPSTERSLTSESSRIVPNRTAIPAPVPSVVSGCVPVTNLHNPLPISTETARPSWVNY